MIPMILALAGAAAPTGAPVDIFPQDFIFEARVVRVSPSAWKAGPKSTRSRTVQVEFRVDRILKGEARNAAPAALTATIPETSKSGGRLESGDSVWGETDFSADDVYLVFGSGTDPAAAFLRAKAAYLKRADLPVVEDVEWIVDGQKLDVAAQASRLLSLLEKSPRDRTLFVGQYLVAVARASSGRSRSALLDAMSRVESIRLDEDGRAEMLRSLHVDLMMKDGPPADEIHALTAACVRTLAASRPKEGQDVSARVESVVQVYLPWLAKKSSDWKTTARAALTPAERAQAAAAATRLVTLPLSETSRKVLRELAEALK